MPVVGGDPLAMYQLASTLDRWASEIDGIANGLHAPTEDQFRGAGGNQARTRNEKIQGELRQVAHLLQDSAKGMRAAAGKVEAQVADTRRARAATIGAPRSPRSRG